MEVRDAAHHTSTNVHGDGMSVDAFIMTCTDLLAADIGAAGLIHLAAHPVVAALVTLPANLATTLQHETCIEQHVVPF